MGNILLAFTNMEIKEMQSDVLNFKFSNVVHKELWHRAFTCYINSRGFGGMVRHRDSYRKALLHIKAKRKLKTNG